MMTRLPQRSEAQRDQRVQLSRLAVAVCLACLALPACGGEDTQRQDPQDTTAQDTPLDEDAADADTTDDTASDTADATGADTDDADVPSPEVALVDEALEGFCSDEIKQHGVGATRELRKVTLDGSPEAICNDGSPAIMYVRAAATPAGQGRWVLYMQGGGDCTNYQACVDRWCGVGGNDASRMSSRFAPEGAAGAGLFARNGGNAFGDANQVFLYYCSSDTWVGQHSDVVLEDPDGLGEPIRMHFRGHDILEAAADALDAGVTSDDGSQTLPPLSTATEVLFTGSSAGSSGLTQSLDWWAARVPQAQRVGGVLDAVYLPLPEDMDDPVVAATWEAGLQGYWATVKQQTQLAFSDATCLAMHPGDDAWLCGLTTHVQLHHITTPFFVRQDLRDPVTFPLLEQAGATLQQAAAWTRVSLERLPDLRTQAEERDQLQFTPGVYATNCTQHVALFNGPWFGTSLMENATLEAPDGTAVTFHDALAAWIGGTPVELIDTHPSTLSHCVGTTDDM